MKKLILISLLSISPALFSADIGVRIQTPIGNNAILDIGFRSDDHRYDNRYRSFDYNRYGYYDNFGYYFGYFDRTGYFYNNIFFLYDSRYSYYDRLHRRGNFRPSHPHYRKYVYHKNNDWNRTHQFRDNRQPIYGPYYDKEYSKQNHNMKKHNNNDKPYYKEHKQYNNNKQYKEQRQFKDDRGPHR